MDSEISVYGVLTVVVVLGSIVLLAGVGAFDHTRIGIVGAGGAIMVLGILGLAGYTAMLPEPEGHDAESGH
jgi:hypothetical protein